MHDFGSLLDFGGLGVCACLALVVILTSVVSVRAYNMTSVVMQLDLSGLS